MKFTPFLILALLTACASREEKEEKLTKALEEKNKASAMIHSMSQPDIKGTVEFEEKDDSLIVKAQIEGLKKNAQHGFHIHEMGVCEGPEYKTAGDHFNPHKMKHGSPESQQRHSGDMGNLRTDKDGVSSMTVTLKGVKLEEVMGKSVLIHEKKDDLKTQPSGDSGKRVACGLIRPME